MRKKKLRCEDCLWYTTVNNQCNNVHSKWFGRVLKSTTIACPEIQRWSGLPKEHPEKAYKIKDTMPDLTKVVKRIKKIKEEPTVWDKMHEISMIPESKLGHGPEIERGIQYQKQKISRLSDSKKVKKAKIYATKAKYIKMFDPRCFLCPNPGTDAFHIFPIGKFPEYETEPWNIILSCRTCNHIWDQGTIEQIMALPNVWWLLWTIWNKDQDPNKLHKGSYFYQRMNRKNK